METEREILLDKFCAVLDELQIPYKRCGTFVYAGGIQIFPSRDMPGKLFMDLDGGKRYSFDDAIHVIINQYCEEEWS